MNKFNGAAFHLALLLPTAKPHCHWVAYKVSFLRGKAFRPQFQDMPENVEAKLVEKINDTESDIRLASRGVLLKMSPHQQL